ncbi:MAG TPA: hypothetical protein VFR09_06815 [Alphaproteobacteria bacterium]|nr:hypothetical protein [Alphaproteobacteria bacterium]
MQVTPLPLPVLPNSLPQDAVVRALPAAQAQAAAPITSRATDPSSKQGTGKQTRTKQEQAKGGDTAGTNLGNSVNIKV